MTNTDSGDALVLSERRGPVALVTLNRPERGNAWNPSLGRAYIAALRAACADDTVRAIVVTGAGKAFCVGADLALVSQLEASGGRGSSLEATVERSDPTFVMSLDKPVIAAVNGGCVGYGLGQALMCDLRFAAEGAKLGTGFARRGLIAEMGITWLLSRLVSHSTMTDLLLSGRTVTAAEALTMGLVDRIVGDGEVVDVAVAYANELAVLSSPTSMAIIKAQLRRDPPASLAQCLAVDRLLTRESWGRSDLKEGVASFKEKRPPQFGPLDADAVDAAKRVLDATT